MRLEIRGQVAETNLFVAAMHLSLVMQFLFGPEKPVVGEVALRQLLITELRQVVADHQIVTVELPLLREAGRKRDRLAVSGDGFLNAPDEVQEVAEPAAEKAPLAAVEVCRMPSEHVFHALDSRFPSSPALQDGKLFCNF